MLELVRRGDHKEVSPCYKAEKIAGMAQYCTEGADGYKERPEDKAEDRKGLGDRYSHYQ